MKTRRIALLALCVAACAPAAATSSRAPGSSPVLRVYDTQASRFVSFDAMVDAASKSDVVFFGEQHDDPVTHATELALLAAVGDRRGNIVLSLEMFERDAQKSLDDYLAGGIDEATFLAASRPWDRYTTDYRGMVELARVRGWSVLASNVPRRLASVVSRGGLGALDTLSWNDRTFIAREHQCPRDDEYFTRFAEQMRGHGGGGPASAPDTAGMRVMTERFYEAQCVKDEAMGEAIADASKRAGNGSVVVHYDGSFHSDFGLGTAARARRRMPGARTLVISAIPVISFDSLEVDSHRRRGDFIVFTRRMAVPPAGR